MVEQTVSDGSAHGDRAGFDEARRHLLPVIDQLSEKFPEAGRDHVAEIVAAE